MLRVRIAVLMMWETFLNKINCSSPTAWAYSSVGVEVTNIQKSLIWHIWQLMYYFSLHRVGVPVIGALHNEWILIPQKSNKPFTLEIETRRNITTLRRVAPLRFEFLKKKLNFIYTKSKYSKNQNFIISIFLGRCIPRRFLRLNGLDVKQFYFYLICYRFNYL